VMGAKAQKVARESGALVYWQDAAASQARVDADYKKIEDMFRRMGDL